MSWACAVCTYENQDAEHLACAMCGEARGGVPETAVRIEPAVPSLQGRQTSQASAKPSQPRSFAAALASTSGTLPTGPQKPNRQAGPNVGASGFVFEAKDMRVGKDVLKGEYHMVMKHMSGTLNSVSIAKLVDIEFQPHAIKRLHLQYYCDRNDKAVDVNGPSDDANVFGRAFIEFYPAKGLQEVLRQHLGWVKDTFTRKDDISGFKDTLAETFMVPFFPLKSKEGLDICPFAAKVCRKKNCPMAHEPEGWGIVRFDGKRPEESVSPGQINRKKSIATGAAPKPYVAATVPAVIPQPVAEPVISSHDELLRENIRLLEAARKKKEADDAMKAARQRQSLQTAVVPQKKLFCNACGIERVESSFPSGVKAGKPNYCMSCIDKGVPKVECPRCFLMHYKLDFIGPICADCGDEAKPPARSTASSLKGRHHIRIDFDNTCIISKNEAVFLLEPVIGPLEGIDVIENPESLTPIGMRVGFKNWDYASMAPKVRGILPPLGVRLVVDDLPVQQRVEELYSLVPATLSFQEYEVLESFYRQPGASKPNGVHY